MRDNYKSYDNDNDDVFTMDEVLYNFGKNVRSLMGEIGTPSKVFDESE